MDPKTYPHPLFSFQMLRHGPPAVGLAVQRADERRSASLRATEADACGETTVWLTVSATLLRRGQTVTCAACQRAVEFALAEHDRRAGAFAEFGLSRGWADDMRHWLGEMQTRDTERAAALASCHQHLDTRARLVSDSYELWRRVGSAARLAGVTGSLARRRAMPHDPTRLRDSLALLHPRVSTPAAIRRLQEHGFTAAHAEKLSALIADLGALIRGQADATNTARRLGTDIAIIRGALIGDLLRLRHAAAAILPPREAAALQIRSLLPVWQRPSRRALEEERRALRGAAPREEDYSSSSSSSSS